MWLANDGNSNDELGDTNLEKITVQWALGIKRSLQVGIYCGEFFQQAVYPICKMFISGSKQYNGNR